MAGNPFATIEVVDLTQVCGGLDQQTRAARLAISQATAAMTDVARAVAPKDNTMTQMMMEALGRRGSGAGPTPAPALPPTSTLSR
jgi:hypothetical protein